MPTQVTIWRNPVRFVWAGWKTGAYVLADAWLCWRFRRKLHLIEQMVSIWEA